MRGGAPYAGGRAIETPFGTVFGSNITPDVKTGIGSWTASHFWRAMHNGRSKDGRLLVPAFPYTNFTLVTREDADALFAYLRTLPAVEQPNRAHALRFPYDTQAALAVWRALFFTPGVYEADQRQVRRVEPRQLPGARTGPLQRLSRRPQRVRRDAAARWR